MSKKTFSRSDMISDFLDLFRGRNLLKEYKEFRKKHAEWEDLSSEEKKKIPKKEWPDYIMYKNTSEYYTLDNCTDYVTDYKYQTQILPRLNKLKYARYGIRQDAMIFGDKNYMDIFMDSLQFPRTLIRNVGGVLYDAAFHRMNYNEALTLLNTYDEVVFKASVYSGHGKGVSLVSRGKYESTMEELGKNYICQERMQQHAFLAHFNESSVNIIRLTTLFWKGEIILLSGILRVGAPGAFCDHLGCDGIGPRYMCINEDGTLSGKAYDRESGILYNDCFGKMIEGKIPQWEEMKAQVLKAHEKYPHFGIVGWDMTVSDQGNVICIEYNAGCPDVVRSQILCGPIFAKRTERGSSCLEEILHTPKDYIL